jgi:hypothetical protein
MTPVWFLVVVAVAAASIQAMDMVLSRWGSAPRWAWVVALVAALILVWPPDWVTWSFLGVGAAMGIVFGLANSAR